MRGLQIVVLCITGLVAAAGAQAPATGPQVAAPPPARVQAPMGTAMPQPAVDVTPLLSELNSTAQAINLNLARLRIEKWKADSSAKQQAQDNANAISRNLTNALPAVIDQVRTNPQSLAAVFKLYRNVNVLYDVFTGLTEEAGAFGPKADYQQLASDLNNLDSVRRSLGDRLENLATVRDTEVLNLRNQLQQAKAAAPPPAPKKVIVDDEEKPKKTTHKKKSSTTKTESQPAAKPPSQ